MQVDCEPQPAINLFKTVRHTPSPRGCIDYLLGGNLENGYYTLYDKQNQRYTAYCDFTSEPGSAWTLVVSFSRHTVLTEQSQVRGSSFIPLYLFLCLRGIGSKERFRNQTMWLCYSFKNALYPICSASTITENVYESLLRYMPKCYANFCYVSFPCDFFMPRRLDDLSLKNY